MLFNSFSFLLFFPIVTLLYYAFPHRFRWLILLVSSCVFYMAFIPVYIIILFTAIIIDYFLGILIEKETGPRKKTYLVASILSTCILLFVFKYFNFFNTNISSLAHFLHWNYPIGSLSIILPIGLSFHTFQSLSYVIEVYRGNQKAEYNFGIYALYVMFYPQLVAGPIERPQNVLHQFYERHSPDYDDITRGLRLMLWGLFKKVVIADNLAIIANTVYNNPTSFRGLSLIFATIAFAFQIYCDFSGYSDIALGTARVMGFKLMKNFDSPYASKSIGEFWRRWHISLSTWFRDYIYIPMGGNRVSKFRRCFNLFFVFLVSGLWHGANWTFIIWGAIHGIYQVVSIITKNIRNSISEYIGLNGLPKLKNAASVIFTFVLVCIAWVFFRASSLNDAVHIISGMFNGALNISTLKPLIAGIKAAGIGNTEVLVIILAVLIMEAVQLLQRKKSLTAWISRRPAGLRIGMYYFMIMYILLFGAYSAQEFIYFQF